MTYFAFIFQRVNLDRDRFKSSGKKYHMMPHRITLIEYMDISVSKILKWMKKFLEKLSSMLT